MPFTYGFYNYVEGEAEPKEYDAQQFGEIFDGLISDGIFATYGKKFMVKPGSNPGVVIVQSGRAWLLHTWNYVDDDLDIDALAPHGTFDRYDALVIDVDNEARTNQIKWVQGTASSNPSYPTLVGYDSDVVTHKQFPLCYLKRRAGVTTIDPTDIENSIGVEKSEYATDKSTPFVICPVDKAMDVPDEMLANWEYSFQDYMEQEKINFAAWFQTIRGQLDEDAAAHLQDEIDALSKYVEETVTLSASADVEVTFVDPYIAESSFFDLAGEYDPSFENIVCRDLFVSGNTVTVTFPRYIGEGYPPTFKVRLYLR